MSTLRAPEEDRSRPLRRGEPPGDILRLLVAHVIDYAIFALDADGNIASWNDGAERMKGYTAEEIVGRHFSIFYPPAAIRTGHPDRELEIATAEGRYEEEGWRLRKDGTRFWANVVITALHEESGRLVGFAKVTRDLTERRAAESRALEDARRVAEAEAANRAKSQFLMALSHELRTPLNAISGYVDLLALGVHGPVTEAQQDALGRIRASQRHLLHLITDLLNLSRIEAGRMEYDLGPVPLAVVIREVRPMIEPLAKAKGISVAWEDPMEPIVAWADRLKVEQIVLNLLTNAIKYTDLGGRVAVRPYQRPDSAALEVEDTGIGIPPGMLEPIFEPFTQVGRSYSSPQDGAGLGLAISRDMARAMGGDLTARSTEGAGSTFTLTLPLHAAPDTGQGVSQAGQAPS